MFQESVPIWNRWRQSHPEIEHPDLSRSHFPGPQFRNANLSGVDFRKSSLRHADFSGADLRHANFSEADLFAAKFRSSNLASARFPEANLDTADLVDANLTFADITETNFFDSKLKHADLSYAVAHLTLFVNTDLSQTKGLDKVIHKGPSTVGIDTLYRSGSNIAEGFLRGCGVPDMLISYLPSLVGVEETLQFYSCFISYSKNDEEFATQLYSRLREAHIRVWYALEDVKGGEKLRDQIDRAIQVHDRSLIVLSENSMQSKWVETEIRGALGIESAERRRKLFPLRLTSYDVLRSWKCFDSDTGEDLARTVREYFIPDFSNWKEPSAFDKAFQRLLRDLKAAIPGNTDGPILRKRRR